MEEFRRRRRTRVVVVVVVVGHGGVAPDLLLPIPRDILLNNTLEFEL